MPKIQNLDTKFTIGLGSELLFDWVLQNKGQLRINYSKEEAETIISNCGNTLYILSKDRETAQETSDEVGHTTVNVMGHQLQGNVADLNGLNSILDAVPVISMEELLRLIFNIVWVFVVGFKGNEWAWQKGDYQDVETFKAVQATWNRAGLVQFIVAIVIFVLYMFVFASLVTSLINGNY